MENTMYLDISVYSKRFRKENPYTYFMCGFLSANILYDSYASQLEARQRKLSNFNGTHSKVYFAADGHGGGYITGATANANEVSYRHNNNVNMLFLDSHVKSLNLSTIEHGLYTVSWQKGQ